MTTKEIKAEALAIINVKYPEIRLSDFTVRQAKGVIAEFNYAKSKLICVES